MEEPKQFTESYSKNFESDIDHGFLFKEILFGADKPREGWLRRGIEINMAETIREHSEKVLRAALCYGFYLLQQGIKINITRFAIMMLIHDMVENPSFGKDYVPGEIDPERKKKIEKSIAEIIGVKLGTWGKKFERLFKEYEEDKTLESTLGKQLDKICPSIQAMEYERMGYENVIDFYPYTEKKIKDETLKKVFSVMMDIRNNWKEEYDRKDILEQLKENLEAVKNHHKYLSSKRGYFYPKYYRLLTVGGNREKYEEISEIEGIEKFVSIGIMSQLDFSKV